MDLLLTQKWNKYLDKFDDSKKDIYFYEEYVTLYETKEEKAFCVVCCENDNVALMPFIRRQIGAFYDFETAYGYGGVICNTDDKTWIDKAVIEIENYLRKENYICGFIRFHTLLENVKCCEERFQVIYDRKTVSINTEMDAEQIWDTQIISKNRNMIRKAEKNGLEYKAE